MNRIKKLESILHKIDENQASLEYARDLFQETELVFVEGKITREELGEEELELLKKVEAKFNRSLKTF
ncbi:MAG: hypothetical protein MRERV_64c010 [Mycoplasmataceae bacterium RV_VA103A]|nr:MAG: hypothetical protein MRERV_64c010 [Mycoplasmataceae bacterium RV_VA103A]